MEMIIRGRRISSEELAMIRDLIETHRHRSRRFLSQELCRLWNWTQANGTWKDAACRALLLRLGRAGLVQLPRPRWRSPQRSFSSSIQLPLGLPEVPVVPPNSWPTDLEWRQVQAPSEFRLFQHLIQTHHYLGHRPSVGSVLRYIAYNAGEPLACLSWSAAAWKVGVRDRFIGWTATQRQKNLPLVIDNTRFLILNRTPHLASHLLASNIHRLAIDWQHAYGVTPVLLETFVDTTRFKGTCYKAANWVSLGLTQGRGKNDLRHLNDKPVKAVFVYPLDKCFRDILTRE